MIASRANWTPLKLIARPAAWLRQFSQIPAIGPAAAYQAWPGGPQVAAWRCREGNTTPNLCNSRLPAAVLNHPLVWRLVADPAMHQEPRSALRHLQPLPNTETSILAFAVGGIVSVRVIWWA